MVDWVGWFGKAVQVGWSGWFGWFGWLGQVEWGQRENLRELGSPAEEERCPLLPSRSLLPDCTLLPNYSLLPNSDNQQSKQRGKA